MGGQGNRELEAMKILLVEDSDDIRDAFCGLLRAEGAEVVAVAEGNAAVSAAVGEDFDILLTDYGLPDIPGDLVIRQVLTGARRRPRVVVVTGYGEPYAGRARKAGADLVLTKPVGWPDLLKHLRPTDRRIAA
jgi:two-component system CheB/CheR fusion protein